MNFKWSLLATLILATAAFADENEIQNAQVENTLTKNSTITTTTVGSAKDWGLTEQEWQAYIRLMNGPSKHYYPKLSPAEVLGINAGNVKDLKHYAEVAARYEHDKLARELRFNAAFEEAANRLYADEPLIKPFDYTPFTPIPKNKT